MASKMVCRELVPFEGPPFCPVPSSSTIHRSSKMNTSSPSTSILLKRRTVQQVQVHSSPSRLTNFGSLTPHRSASQEHLPSSPSASQSSVSTVPQVEDASLTQPLSQERMRQHPPASQQYSELLVEAGHLVSSTNGTWVAVGGDKQDSTSRLGLGIL